MSGLNADAIRTEKSVLFQRCIKRAGRLKPVTVMGNTASRLLQPERPSPVSFGQAIPPFRVVDGTQAREFCCDFRGPLTMEPGLPL